MNNNVFINCPFDDCYMLVLDKEPDAFRRAFSDIAGNDPEIHHDSVSSVIEHVSTFLSDKNGSGTLPGPTHFKNQFDRFNRALPNLARKLKITPAEIKTRNRWRTYVKCANSWIEMKSKR